MDSPALLRIAANATLAAHAAFVLFVVLGLVLILLGGVRRWAWVRNRRFRLLHLGATGFVVAESWLGLACPLTTLELWLRQLAGQAAYDGDFIAFWLRRLIFFEAPPWVFTLAYTAFGGLVIASWWLYPPRGRSHRP